jgi:hypothetical protein
MEQNQLDAVIAAAGMCTAYNADDWAGAPVQAAAPASEASANTAPLTLT